MHAHVFPRVHLIQSYEKQPSEVGADERDGCKRAGAVSVDGALVYHSKRSGCNPRGFNKSLIKSF